MLIIDSLLNFNLFLSGEVRRTSLFTLSHQAHDASSSEQSLAHVGGLIGAKQERCTTRGFREDRLTVFRLSYLFRHSPLASVPNGEKAVRQKKAARVA